MTSMNYDSGWKTLVLYFNGHRIDGSLSLSVSFSVCLSVCLSVCISLSLSLSLSLSVVYPCASFATIVRP